MRDTKPLLLAGTIASFCCCYLFGTSSPTCRPAASPAAASSASACAPTPATGAAQVSEVDLQLRCDVVGRFAEMVIAGLVSGGLLIKTIDWTLTVLRSFRLIGILKVSLPNHSEH